MEQDDTFSALFARCPVYLWPILAMSLIPLREKVRSLRERGATAWVVGLTHWGYARVVDVCWPDGPANWQDSVYRTAMGEPTADPIQTPPRLGICSDDASADWACGTGIYALISDAADLCGSTSRRAALPMADTTDGAPWGHRSLIPP